MYSLQTWPLCEAALILYLTQVPYWLRTDSMSTGPRSISGRSMMPFVEPNGVLNTKDTLSL